MSTNVKKRKLEAGQTTLDGKFVQAKQPTSSLQANFDESVFEYVVYNLRPYSTVVNPQFRRMFKVANPSIKVMGHNKLDNMISSRAQRDREQTIKLFNGVKYVATSADMWSCSKHGYMGMTATAILPTYKRVNRAISCEHFQNPHTGPRIAELIARKHESLDLVPPKLVGTVTDNGQNIVNAFDMGSIDSNVKTLLDELAHLVDTLPNHNR